MIHVDSSMLSTWLQCREKFRLRYLEQGNGIQPLKPALLLVVGGAFHSGVEVFWKGGSYEEAMARAMADMDIDETLLNVQEQGRLQDSREMLPDMLSCYFTEQEYAPERIWQDPLGRLGVELEWGWPNGVDVTLCGKLDRVEVGPIIYDCKTASEVGKNWKHDYRQGLLRDVQFQLYDYYLTSIGHPPIMSVVEVITKPYKGKPPKFIRFELPELAAYRERFKQQLDWNLKEMVHYVTKYREARPWPMASSQTCIGKYGPCDFIEGCNKGWNAKLLEAFGPAFGPREEHLASVTRRIG